MCKRFSAHVNTHERAGEHLANSLVDGMRRGNVIMAQHQCQRIPIEPRIPSRMGPKCFELRTEEQGTAALPEVQRLLTEPIAGEIQRALLAIPERECKHPSRAPQGGFHAPALHGFQQHFGV